MRSRNKKIVNFEIEPLLLQRFDSILDGQKRTPIFVRWIERYISDNERAVRDQVMQRVVQ